MKLASMLSIPVMSATLTVSSLVVLSSNSWAVVWVALEMNTMSFCMMIYSKASQKKKSTEAAMKYFIVQSTASAIMILYLSTPTTITGTKLLFMAGTTAILVKLASAPFHSWFLDIMPKMSTKMSMILMTWQKLAPIYILMFMMKTAVIASILVSSIVGSITQLTKNKLMEIMALSSIFNLSWMMLASIISTKTLLAFTMAYWTVLVSVMMLFLKHKALNNSIHLPSSVSPLIMTLMMASLAGLPPTLGFYAKLQVVVEALKLSMKEIISLVLVISAMNFYIYLRMTSPSTIMAPACSQKSKEKTHKALGLILMMNFLPMTVMTL